jgi:hypothetical protein
MIMVSHCQSYDFESIWPVLRVGQLGADPAYTEHLAQQQQQPGPSNTITSQQPV